MVITHAQMCYLHTLPITLVIVSPYFVLFGLSPQIYIYITLPNGSSRTFWAGINAMIWKVKYVLRKYLDP